ncbi:MAG: aminoacyl-tRNA hydrolase, partial [Oscillospiraceae bacterium]
MFAKLQDQNQGIYLIVGLGNPGLQYEKTRHNAGFLALDYLCKKNSKKIDRLKFKSLSLLTELVGHKVLFLKPQTFMNISGEAVVAAMQFYKIPIARVIVIYDDISLDVGKMRVRRNGSHGGHN